MPCPAASPVSASDAAPGMGPSHAKLWALHLLERLGTQELGARMTGDGAEGMVQAWASRDEASDGSAGSVVVALWNGTLDQSKIGGAGHLDRHVVLELDGLEHDGAYVVMERRVDADHSNIGKHWRGMGGVTGGYVGTDAAGADWPDDAQWAALRAVDRLDDGAPPRRVTAEHGRVTVEVDLPNPGMVLIEVVPDRG